MKEKTLYVCDFCKTQYANKEECKKCETSHIKPKKIVSEIYKPFKVVSSGYPIHIHVEFENGEVRRYIIG